MFQNFCTYVLCFKSAQYEGLQTEMLGRGIVKKTNIQTFCIFSGDDCGEVDCPGDPNCFGRGECSAEFDPPECRNCLEGWYGPACNDVCFMGNASVDNKECVCNTTCWHGPGCDIQCSQHGECDDAMECYCDPWLGWRGDQCEDPGCPYDPEQTNGIPLDCTGHGECDSYQHVCECNPGWIGSACHVPDCPEKPDCMGRGICNSSFETPRCVSCETGWMGPGCNDPCVNGTQTPMDSGFCLCDPGKYFLFWEM